MKLISFTKIKSLRKARNQEILRRLDNGESLSSFNSYASWFPPRPIMEKDTQAIQELYGTKPNKKLSAQTDSNQDNDLGNTNLKADKPLRLA